MDKLKKYMKAGGSAQDAGLDLTNEAIQWRQQVSSSESGQSGSSSAELLTVLEGLKSRIKEVLGDLGISLDQEHVDCEAMRVSSLKKKKVDLSVNSDSLV